MRRLAHPSTTVLATIMTTMALALSALVTGFPTTASAAEIVYEIDFETDASGWYPFGSATVEQTDAEAHTGAFSLATTNRTAAFEGPAVDLTAALASDTVYDVSAWVLMPEAGTIGLTMKRTDGAAVDNYEGVASTAVEAGTWTEITGSYRFDDASALNMYAESATLADVYIDDVVITADETLPPPPVGTVIDSDFEAGLDGWVARDAQGSPTVGLTDDAHESTQALQVSDRSGQGDGSGLDVTGVMVEGGNYDITAWLKMAEGAGDGDLSLTMRRTTDGADSFDTIAQFPGITAGAWVEVTGTYRMVANDAAFMYFETVYPDGTSDSFLVDDVVVESVAPPVVQEITPLQDTVPFHTGVAIDKRETVGPASELVLRHFDQITPENYMKPATWYDEDRNFGINPEATAVMDFAQANDIDLYGHTLVWHQQTPVWFFETDDGTPLTDSSADRAILDERLRFHIFSIAETLSDEYGPFGSDTNPLTAWDVVNEVVSDGESDDGLRTNRWHDVFGEDYIDLAFRYADEAFNDVYAAPGTDRPVLLAINEYNTEQAPKRQRLHDLVERLLARGVPVDVVGHQFHANLYVPVENLAVAIEDFRDLPVTQVVSELDVPTGVPVTDALLIDQGYYYRDAFRIFREHADDLYSVSVWGLTDDRSWLAAEGDPLLFDDDLQAKFAYDGAVDAELPPPLRSADVFESDGDTAVDSPTWDRLPLEVIDGDTAFQLRWSADELTAYVEVADTSVDADDGVTFVVGEATYTVGRDGSGDVEAEIVDTDTGYTMVVPLPLTDAAEGDLVSFDVQVTNGASTVAWNEQGAIGTLSLIEMLSFTETVEAPTAPVVDATIDDEWAAANAVMTDTIVQGDADGATATVRTLWEGSTLYVLGEVTDSTPDVSASDPYQQDSLEIFLDIGNNKNGTYRPTDSQIRISSANELSFGAGDAVAQEERLTSATATTPSGYVVEAAIDLGDLGGVDTFHGIDFQVNDGTAGTRTSVRTWADPTGVGYQTTAHWGVTQLVAADTGPVGPTEPECDRTVSSFEWGLRVDDGVVCMLPGTVVIGSVTVTSGASLVADGATIFGRVRTRGAATVSITDSLVIDSTKVANTTGDVVLSDNVLLGGASVVRNEVTGDVIVSANTVFSHLRCRGNSPAPTDDGRPNRVWGRVAGQCSSWW